AVARGVPNVYAYSSSPPSSMKSNGQFYKGGHFIGNQQNYYELASILTSYVTFAKNNGVKVTHLGVQNEPDQNQPYPSALWTAREFHDFIPYLYSALGKAGYAATKIVFPEPSGWSIDYGGFAAATMADALVAPYVGVLGMHAYSGSAVAPTNYGYGQRVWQT